MPDFPRGEWKKGQPEPDVTKLTARPVQSGSSCIEVDGLAQVQDVFAVLQAGRIDYEVADQVSCAYQG